MNLEEVAVSQALARRGRLSYHEQVEARVVELREQVFAWTVLSKAEVEPREAIAAFSRYSQVCCADWSPDGSRLALVVSTRDENRSTTIAVASIDRATGTASALRRLTTLPGGAPEYGRWSPDGRLLVYEALTDGSWDLWIVDPDAPTPRRLTAFPSNDRQAAWQKQPLALYFRRDDREVWRLPFDRAGLPAGPATPWLILPRGVQLAADSLSINPSDDRLLTSLTVTASDIWLVEFQ